MNFTPFFAAIAIGVALLTASAAGSNGPRSGPTILDVVGPLTGS